MSNFALACAMKRRKKMAHGGMAEGSPEGGEDLVSRAMKKRNGYSEGGMASNEDEVTADFEPAEFDDLAKRDDLEASDTGANSGDEVGNSQEETDRDDIISRAKRSWAKRDRNPRPT